MQTVAPASPERGPRQFQTDRKFASNNRQNGTDAENKAVVQGALAYYGTYEVDESNKSLIMRIEYSSFPNFNGAEQRRNVKLENDELTVVNSAAASGGTSSLIWKRVK
jgi:enoyl reductase-like protein